MNKDWEDGEMPAYDVPRETVIDVSAHDLRFEDGGELIEQLELRSHDSPYVRCFTLDGKGPILLYGSTLVKIVKPQASEIEFIEGVIYLTKDGKQAELIKVQGDNLILRQKNGGVIYRHKKAIRSVSLTPFSKKS